MTTRAKTAKPKRAKTAKLCTHCDRWGRMHYDCMICTNCGGEVCTKCKGKGKDKVCYNPGPPGEMLH